MKQFFAYFFILMFFSSCNYFKIKKTTSETILKEELKTFRWNEVDIYPTFSSCDSTLIKIEKKQCFETMLSNHILETLQRRPIVVTQNVQDTIMVNFEISEKGVLNIKNIKVNDLTQLEIPTITTSIEEGLESLPKIFPAIKRGQQVKTAFVLPLEISVN